MLLTTLTDMAVRYSKEKECPPTELDPLIACYLRETKSCPTLQFPVLHGPPVQSTSLLPKPPASRPGTTAVVRCI